MGYGRPLPFQRGASRHYAILRLFSGNSNLLEYTHIPHQQCQAQRQGALPVVGLRESGRLAKLYRSHFILFLHLGHLMRFPPRIRSTQTTAAEGPKTGIPIPRCFS